MKWTEVHYTVKRTRKEATHEVNGHTIMLKEIYNSKDENIFCHGKLMKDGTIITERYYSLKNRNRVIDELMNIANGNNPTGYDAMTGEPLYK
jgi:hypothetical protein